MQCATMATTFGVYFAHLTTRAEQEEEQLPAVLVSSVPSIMAFTMFLFCPISTALSKVGMKILTPSPKCYISREFPNFLEVHAATFKKLFKSSHYCISKRHKIEN